jgi:hypothetical protein
LRAKRRPTAGLEPTAEACHTRQQTARHDQPINATLAAWFGAADTQRAKESPGIFAEL